MHHPALPDLHINIHTVTTLLVIYSIWNHWSSAAVAAPLQGLTCCVFRDALLHTTVLMQGYLSYCHLPVSLNQSEPSPPTSLINKVFSSTELLLSGCV